MMLDNAREHGVEAHKGVACMVQGRPIPVDSA
jgi:hypothetical protein